MKFNSDAIDETDVLEENLKPRVESIGGTIEKVQLSGSHITPCIQVCYAYISHEFAYMHSVFHHPACTYSVNHCHSVGSFLYIYTKNTHLWVNVVAWRLML